VAFWVESVVDPQPHRGVDVEASELVEGHPANLLRFGIALELAASGKQIENCWRTSPSS